MRRLAAPRRLMLAAAVSFLAAAPAGAADLTIQPAHVFTLWQNVNDCLVTAVRATTTKMVLIGEIRDMQAAAFDGKTPADVFERTAVVREKIELIRKRMGLAPWPGAVKVDGTAVQASHTYLSAGVVLDGLASLMVQKTGPEQAVSVCYAAAPADGKSASDVYSMVDLADRRLDAVLEALGA